MGFLQSKRLVKKNTKQFRDNLRRDAIKFSLEGINGIIPQRGDHSSLTAASTITTEDFEGVYRTTPANGSAHTGARVVYNLLSSSAAPATQTLTSLAAGDYVYQHSGTGEVRLSGATDGSYGSVTTTGERKRLAFTVTTAQNVTVTVTSAPDWFQLQNKTGDEVITGTVDTDWFPAIVTDVLKFYQYETDTAEDRWNAMTAEQRKTYDPVNKLAGQPNRRWDLR